MFMSIIFVIIAAFAAYIWLRVMMFLFKWTFFISSAVVGFFLTLIFLVYALTPEPQRVLWHAAWAGIVEGFK